MFTYTIRELKLLMLSLTLLILLIYNLVIFPTINSIFYLNTNKFYSNYIYSKTIPINSHEYINIKDDKENKSTYIKTDVEGTLITITCYNFNNSLGSGTVYPQNLATIGGKKLYFHFIVYKISQESSRHIIYTFYEDIK